ncbi:twin-arginine translocation signal domain-containing protein [Rhizobium lusitanum]|uniref:outer-membrane lipoprotein carrier protein LolA n=1 Tax=Rhizobium lusitanum TaxID=293958 RepID=UPI0016168078|nr:outer membrane lipoprotein carrier protein LolA [Rhizobium lusitanum]QND48693.1 twin-arginine translocation signal domain-containing protein [Rhizobium lusitanum]
MKKTDALPSSRLTLTRRHFLGAVVAAGAASMAPVAVFAQTASLNPGLAQQIADHFSSIKSMKGGFLQIGPRGDQVSGSFFIQRPGKMRFNYDPPSRMRVICDGNNVQVINDQTRTKNMYQLSKTPLSLLLANKIDLSADMVRGVESQSDLTKITLGNRTVFGDSTIAMLFDSKTFDLRQWTVIDPQGKTTDVIINNVKPNVAFDDSVFRIDYTR